MSDISIFNPELMKIARDRAMHAAGVPVSPVLGKAAFVDPATAGAADASMGGGAVGGAPPPMDPMAAGAMAGPMPPMPDMGMGEDGMGGGMGPGSVEERLAKLETGGGGAIAGEDAAKKPKVDVNTEIYHIKKMLAKLLDTLGVQMDASDMLGDPAEDPEVPATEAAQDPHSAASQSSSISPIQPVEGASLGLAAAGGAGGAGGGAEVPKAAGYSGNGSAQPAPQMLQMSDRASALAAVLRRATDAR